MDPFGGGGVRVFHVGGMGPGAMGGMVTGFRRAIGVEKKKKKTWVDYTWTILLLLAIGGILFWRFGRG